MNNFDEIVNNLINNKENINCPILKLGYLISLECKSIFIENGGDFNDLFTIPDNDIFLPKIILNFDSTNIFLNQNKRIQKKFKNFNLQSFDNSQIDFSQKINFFTNKNTYFPIDGNISNDSICFHSVGDPFIQGWVYQGKLNNNISWVSANISSLYEKNLSEVTLKERLIKIENYIDANNFENIFLLFLPTFSLENYLTFKKALLSDIIHWPNYKAHIGASTCFTDPVFHLIAEYKNIPNIGVQHGGGPMTIYSDYDRELLAYNEFYFLPPYKKNLHNTRGDQHISTILIIESIKIYKYLFYKDFRIFNFKNFFLRSIFRIFKYTIIKLKRFIISYFHIKPIIILDKFNLNSDKSIANLKNINFKFYIKLHPFDNYKDYNELNYLIINNIVEIFPIENKIEFNLWRWRKSFIIINSYNSTVLIFLFEGTVPFLIMLTSREISNISNILTGEALETFNFLIKNNVILESSKFKSLTYLELNKLANNSKNLCIEYFSTSNKLLKRIFSKNKLT